MLVLLLFKAFFLTHTASFSSAYLKLTAQQTKGVIVFSSEQSETDLVSHSQYGPSYQGGSQIKKALPAGFLFLKTEFYFARPRFLASKFLACFITGLFLIIYPAHDFW